MADSKLSKNKIAVEHLKALTTQGALSPEIKWDWESTRRLLWRVIKWDIAPELGVNPKNAELKEEFSAAWKKLCEVLDSGYMVESSNLGKQAAALGFCRKDETAKVESTVAPD